jgi:hypothetical protein
MLSLAIRISRVASILLLLAGLVLSWYHVPIGLKPDAKGGFSVTFADPWSTIIFKVVVVVILLAALFFSRRRSINQLGRSRWLAGAGLGVLLLTAIAYPAFTIQRCAKVSAHGAWLQAENDSMILSYGDSLTGEEYAYQSGQPAVSITEVLPRSFQAVPTMQFHSLFDLHLSDLPAIVMLLGYTPGFCQFVARGWWCILFGALLFAVSFGRTLDLTEPRALLKLGSTLLPAFALTAVLLWGIFLLPVSIAGLELTKSEETADLGRYADARLWLTRATTFLPILAYNTDIVFQEGYFDQKLGVDSAAAKLVTAIRDEEEGFYDRAAGRYADLLDPSNPEPVRDEAFRGRLRRALTDLNAGLDDKASAALTRLLTVDPSSIKVNYALQLADLRRQRKDALEEHVAEFEAVYGSFQSLEKDALLAAAHRRLAELDFDDRDTAHIGDEMRAAVKP